MREVLRHNWHSIVLLWIIPFVLILVWALQLQSPLLPQFPVMNVALFILGLVTSFRSFGWATAIVWTLLPFFGSAPQQLSALFGVNLYFANDPGVDVVIGVVAGVFVKRLLGSVPRLHLANEDTWFPKFLSVFAVYLLIFAVITIQRNLFQSASSFTSSGILSNVKMLRSLGWLDDFLPLRTVWIWWSAIMLSALAWLHRNEVRLASHLRPACLGAALVSVVAVFQKVTGYGYFRDGVERGAQGFFSDLHTLSGYLMPFVLGSFVYALQARLPSRRACWIAFWVLTSAGLLASGSRSAIALGVAAHVVAVGVYFAFGFGSTKRQRNLAFVSMGLLLAVSIYLFYRTQLNHLGILKAQGWEQFSVALANRPEFFVAAWNMATEHRILGLGLTTFPRNGFIPDFSKAHRLIEIGPENAHNFFLQIFNEQGLVGLSFLISIIWFGFPANWSSAWIKAVLIGVIITNVYAHSLLVAEVWLLFWLFLGLVVTKPVLKSRNIAAIFKRKWIGVSIAALTATLGGFEIVNAFSVMPLLDSPYCHRMRGQFEDGWTSGLAQIQRVVSSDGKILLNIDAPRPDISSSTPLLVSALVYFESELIQEQEVQFVQPEQRMMEFDLAGRNGQLIDIKLRISRCYTPRNVGNNIDARRLGVLIRY